MTVILAIFRIYLSLSVVIVCGYFFEENEALLSKIHPDNHCLLGSASGPERGAVIDNHALLLSPIMIDNNVLECYPQR